MSAAPKGGAGDAPVYLPARDEEGGI